MGVDVGGAVGQHRVAELLGTTQQTCCSNCTAALACRVWIFAPKNDSGDGAQARSSHSAGSCWLLTGAAKGKPHANRVSGGDLTPRGPAPVPAPDASGGHYDCGPGAYCAMAMAGNLWPRTYADGIVKEGAEPLILSRNVWAGAAAHGVAL